MSFIRQIPQYENENANNTITYDFINFILLI